MFLHLNVPVQLNHIYNHDDYPLTINSSLTFTWYACLNVKDNKKVKKNFEFEKVKITCIKETELIPDIKVRVRRENPLKPN